MSANERYPESRHWSHVDLDALFLALLVDMHWDSFTLGFWHPFGPHGHRQDGTPETPDEILIRKANEIKNNGWTLWSFNGHSKLSDLLTKLQGDSFVYTLCASSNMSNPPKGNAGECAHYRPFGASEWQPVPRSVSVRFPGDKSHAVAFKVKRIIMLAPPKAPAISINWYSTRTGLWNSEYGQGKVGYPPRPECLIKRCDNGAPLRAVRAVLELCAPFLVQLR
jgi:hypothetical protein